MLIRFAIDNALLANLSLILILLLGVMAWQILPQEMFPVVDTDRVKITTEFEGASPAEVEQQVTMAIEDVFEDMPEIDYVASNSIEGLSSIILKLKPKTDVDEFINDARSFLDKIKDLPETAEKPTLSRIAVRSPVITMTLFGEATDASLQRIAKTIRQQLKAIPGVGSVGIAGDRDWEIWVEVDPQQLAAINISLLEINQAIRHNLSDQPGGSIQSEQGDIRLRGQGIAPEPITIARTVIRTNAKGGELRLGDIAQISRRFEEAQNYARFNRQPAINLVVSKTTDASTIEISDAVKTLGRQLQQELPANVDFHWHTDTAEYVNTRLNTVKSSGLLGLVLVLLSLYLLVNLRVALITSFGIPVSFLIATIALYVLGYTINMVSLFAFLVVMGMVVDDAIIVTENIYRHIESGMPPQQAAIQGSQEVLWPVITSTLTTIFAFLPMFAILGIMGAFIEVIPVVVTFALLGSLLEVFAILPTHAAYFLRPQRPIKRRWPQISWKNFTEYYGILLSRCLDKRYITLLGCLSILLISIVYAQTRLGFNLFGDVEIDEFHIDIETSNLYSIEDTLQLTKTLENMLLTAIGEENLDSMVSHVGISFIDLSFFKTGSNLIQFVVNLKKTRPNGLIETYISPLLNMKFSSEGTRERSTDSIINAVRKTLENISGLQRVGIIKPAGGPQGDDIEIGIVSDDLTMIQQKTEALKNYLQQINGVYDIRHDQEPGKLEYKYQLNARGQRLGLTQSDLADAVRNGFLGNKIIHVTWQDERVPVRVIYQESIRQQAQSLADLQIVSNNGKHVYLSDVADITVGRGLDKIGRHDGQRMGKVLADVDTQITTPGDVIRRVNSQFDNDTAKNYQLLYLGEKKNAAESFSGMEQALLMAIIAIFFLLVALFKSFIEPFIIMLTIPFSLIGVIFGHMLFDINLQFLSIIGTLALVGIVVNDSLILVEFIKKSRHPGKNRKATVIDASKIRARPILLTSITTFLGVSPLIFFATGQTAFLSPMAISLGFGLLFATLLILIALPCLYLIADDFRQWLTDRRQAVA